MFYLNRGLDSNDLNIVGNQASRKPCSILFPVELTVPLPLTSCDLDDHDNVESLSGAGGGEQTSDS